MTSQSWQFCPLVLSLLQCDALQLSVSRASLPPLGAQVPAGHIPPGPAKAGVGFAIMSKTPITASKRRLAARVTRFFISILPFALDQVYTSEPHRHSINASFLGDSAYSYLPYWFR